MREDLERKLEDTEYQVEQLQHANEDLQLSVQRMHLTVTNERGKSGVLAVEKEDLESEMAQELHNYEEKCLNLTRENELLLQANQELKENLRIALDQKIVHL
ncbi:hypothetical protein RFI_30900 [Reticulomyxa filosa]|uniref:Uncharacterized protein n=1 Tax=Reticulomyxa filosa TaxID=46433 RepID=X6LY11_RETFI|nr:hypothetical protein RFI_30900 [Reticulomyxa filosa]|eukprot:ETO06494.1 hypothetical protein RFI_30900 [Reticulomyxa filosa]